MAPASPEPPPDGPEPAEPPLDGPELAAWLAGRGLADAELLAVLVNAGLDALTPEQLRLLHGLLEAFHQLRREPGQVPQNKEPGWDPTQAPVRSVGDAQGHGGADARRLPGRPEGGKQ